MTEDEFIQRMTKAAASEDAHCAHTEGDMIVAEALRECGMIRLADLYDDARGDWWYS